MRTPVVVSVHQAQKRGARFMVALPLARARRPSRARASGRSDRGPCMNRTNRYCRDRGCGRQHRHDNQPPLSPRVRRAREQPVRRCVPTTATLHDPKVGTSAASVGLFAGASLCGAATLTGDYRRAAHSPTRPFLPGLDPSTNRCASTGWSWGCSASCSAWPSFCCFTGDVKPLL